MSIQKPQSLVDMTDKWQVGDLVLARALGWNFWPAKIVQKRENQRIYYEVNFYDSHEELVCLPPSSRAALTKDLARSSALVTAKSIKPLWEYPEHYPSGKILEESHILYRYDSSCEKAIVEYTRVGVAKDLESYIKHHPIETHIRDSELRDSECGYETHNIAPFAKMA